MIRFTWEEVACDSRDAFQPGSCHSARAKQFGLIRAFQKYKGVSTASAGL